MPGVIKLGFMPDIALARGSVGVMSKSGTLAYEVCYRLVFEGLGQAVGSASAEIRSRRHGLQNC